MRPGSLLPDVDFEAIGRHLRENYYMESMEQPEVMEQKVLSYAFIRRYMRTIVSISRHIMMYRS